MPLNYASRSEINSQALQMPPNYDTARDRLSDSKAEREIGRAMCNCAIATQKYPKKGEIGVIRQKYQPDDYLAFSPK